MAQDPWQEWHKLVEARLAAELRADVDPDDRAELCQESLIRIFRTTRREEVRHIGALVDVVVKSVVVDWHRRRRRWMTGDVEPETLPDRSAGGTRMQAVEEARFLILEFFAEECPDCVPVAEAYFAGTSWAKAAAELGTTYAAVRKRWSRCRKALIARARAWRALEQIFDDAASDR